MENSLRNVNEVIVEINGNSDIINRTLYNNCLNTIKHKLSILDIHLNNIHLLIKYVMETIEETELKGIDQKKLALAIIQDIISEIKNEDEKKRLEELLHNNTISNIIELIVDATKGKINVNNISLIAGNCIEKCLINLLHKIQTRSN
mgnify:FL=1|tara:strand:- start:1214 stop:1654 length:441 start_codon:yes stop_codon:yes gene_type:complete